MRSGDNDNSESFDAVGGVLSSIATDIEGSDRAPTRPQRDLLAATNARLDRGVALWERVQGADLAEFNVQLKAAGLTQIAVPTADQINLDQAPESKDLP